MSLTWGGKRGGGKKRGKEERGKEEKEGGKSNLKLKGCAREFSVVFPNEIYFSFFFFSI